MLIEKLRLEHVAMLLRGLLWQFTRLRFNGIVLKGRGARIYIDRRVKFNGIIKVGHYAILDLRRTASGRLGDRFSLGDYSILRASGSSGFVCPHVDIAERVSFGPFCNIGGGFGLSIGADLIAGPYVSIHPEGHMHAIDMVIRNQPVFGKGVSIGSDCWLGAKTTILDGSNLGCGTVLGAATLVAGSETMQNGIYVGSPARLVRYRTPSRTEQ